MQRVEKVLAKKSKETKKLKEKIDFIAYCKSNGLTQYEVRCKKYDGKHINHGLIKKVYEAIDHGQDIYSVCRPIGRPTVLDETKYQIIDDALNENGRLTLNEVRNKILEKTNVRVSINSIEKAINTLGYKYRPPQKEQVYMKYKRKKD